MTRPRRQTLCELALWLLTAAMLAAAGWMN